MLDANPMFVPCLDQNQIIAGCNPDLYSGLEPINVNGKNQNSGAFSPPILNFAAFNSYQYEDGMNGNALVLRGGSSNDELDGSSGNDKLLGLAGDDILNGYDGDDLLKGGTGNDRFVGGCGNDILLDYDGGDVMTGGEGADLFWLGGWNQPSTPSTITDFDVRKDTIKIGRLGATFEQLCIQNSAEGTSISDRGNILAILSGVNASSLSADSFLFGNPELATQFQTELDESVNGTTPGATKAIITSDGFTWQGATGVSEVTQQTPMQPDDILNIASVTKTFTAATVLKLVEEGTLSLDDTLGKWLPETAQNLPDSESVTLRQLLNGVGGIPNQYAEQAVSNFINTYSGLLDGSLTDEGYDPRGVASVYGQPRFSGLGSSPIWTYPNTGSDLAGLIVEKATGSSFSSVMREQVLEPLGLERTFFVGDEQISGNVARGYEDIFTADRSLGRDGVLEDYTDVHLLTSADGWASGALYSTAQDVARFSSALFGGELLKPESLKEMLTFVNQGMPVPFEGNGYGLGVASFENPSGREWGKNGDNIAYTAEMRYYPDQGGATTVYLKNSSGFDPAVLADPSAVADPLTNPQITPT